jgi:hypothetical protein
MIISKTQASMKSIILLVFVYLLTCGSVLAQLKRDTLQNALNKEHFLKLSKTQKTQATLLVVTGGATAVIGGCIWYLAPIAGLSEGGDVKGAERTGKTMVIVGTSLAALSIPLFHASMKNQQKAELYMGSVGLSYPLTGAKDLLCLGARITLN